MKCPKCHADNMNSAKFCKHCGSTLENQHLERRDSQYQPNPGFFARNKKVLIIVVIALLIIGFLISALVVSLKSAGRKCKDALDMRDAIIENQKQQASSGNDMGEEGSSSDNRRLASFKAISRTNALAGAILCDSAGGTLQNGVSGDAMCDKGGSVWPTISANICMAGAADGNHYLAKDEVAGDGIFQYQVTCSISGKIYTTTCNDTDCSTI